MKAKSIGIIFGWTGRLLTSATVSKGIDVSFTYNADGIRTSKTVNGEAITSDLNDIPNSVNGFATTGFKPTQSPVDANITASKTKTIFSTNIIETGKTLWKKTTSWRKKRVIIPF